MLTDLNLAAVAAAARDGLEQVAEDIARDARRGAAMHELKSGPDAYHVAVDSDGVKVTTSYRFAHLDEWGGPNIHSTPTGALRSAAAAHGHFTPDAK